MESLPVRGVVSLSNSTLTPLAAGETFTGSWEDVSNYASIEVRATSDVAAQLFADFSIDREIVDSQVPLSDGTSGAMGFKGLVPSAAFFRLRVVNGPVDQASLRVQTIHHVNPRIAMPTSRASQELSDYTDVLNTRAALFGRTSGGQYRDVPITGEGHLEVALHAPTTPFGAVHAERLNTVFQISGTYGLNSTLERSTAGNSVVPTGTPGTITATQGLFKAATGTALGAFSTLQSRRRMPYRAGQGVVGIFEALWVDPVPLSIVVAGLGTAEAGVYFGFNGTTFGILHANEGVREIQTLTVTTGSSSTQPAQVTLGGVLNTIAMTNNGSTLRTAYELAQGSYLGWSASAIGSTVVFVADSSGNKAGAFSVAQSGAGTPIAGTFVETLAGVASTDTWIEQSAWNGDSLDGSGASAATLDPTRLNTFQIKIDGEIEFYVQVAQPGENAHLALVHTIRNAGVRTTPILSQPNLPFTMAAYSAGSTTNTEVHCATAAGFNAGNVSLVGPRLSYEAKSTAVTSGAYRALFTLKNRLLFKGRANQAVINLVSFGGAIEDTTPCTIYLIKNATLLGTPNFIASSANSCAARDVAATTCTFADAEQVVISLPLGSDGHDLLQLLDTILLQPGETVTVAAQCVTGSPAWVLGTLNTREDQS